MNIIHPSEQPRIVEDWDFNFNNGSAISITLDPTTNDYHQFKEGSPLIFFHLGEKLSHVNPEGKIPAEDIYIPMLNVMCIRKRSRLLQPESVEEREEWQRVMEELKHQSITH